MFLRLFWSALVLQWVNKNTKIRRNLSFHTGTFSTGSHRVTEAYHYNWVKLQLKLDKMTLTQGISRKKCLWLSQH